MKPLYVQLKDRYARLKEIRESLWSLEIETLPSEMIEQLDIDFCPLDINTGATSDSVTPYFLPRVSFPSCRDLRSEGRLKDQMIDEGQDRDPRAAFESSVLNRFFPTCLELSQKYYAANLDWDLFHRILRKEERRYGWLAGVLKIQFTELVDFAPFAVRPPPNMDYLDLIDLSQYDDKLDKMLKWAWPVIQGHTGKEGLKEKEREEGSEEKNK
ncbi:hypothetical protein N7486_000522 [Penicillium sp. IBT 16267x]|nr:hypothetical protein N7486_000522 [Penicillium sp. IBT 16267x]